MASKSNSRHSLSVSDPWEQIDWSALERIRAGYLGETAGQEDYWTSESDLLSYDLTFAQRIGWKWDYVCGELRRLGWTPPSAPVLDWGCGTGIAHRTFFRAFPESAQHRLALWDRSSLARDYAGRTAEEQFETLDVVEHDPARAFEGVVLISHVLTELDERGREELAQSLRSASAVVWVEPGTHEVSRSLIHIREALRSEFHVVAPCVHRGACGLLKESRARDWCHHFAPPAPEAFTSPHWALFSHLLGIDLRSLPVSYLILDRRPPAALPANAVRTLGRPRVYKAHTLLLGCDASGVDEARLMKRHSPEVFRRAKKDRLGSLMAWEKTDDEITKAEELGPHANESEHESGTDDA